MNDEQLKRILESAHTIAAVGVSSNPEKHSYGVMAYLKKHGYKVIPVNPTVDNIQGEQAYPDLLAIPDPVEVVQVFRPPEDVPAIVQQAIRIGAKVVWMQLGISNPEAAQLAEAAGLQVVQDACMMRTHIRLFRRVTPAAEQP
jgi:uncharacterized protein